MATINKILCIIVDFASTQEAARLSLQLDQSRKTMSEKGTAIHIVHVDNGNKKTVELTPEQKARGIELLRTQKNDGYAGGVRFAIEKHKDFDAYWFLNSDLEVDQLCLPRLLDVLEHNPKVAAVGPTVFWGNSTRVWGARGVVSPILGLTAMTPWPQGGELPKWSYIPGSSLLIRREAYEQAGGLPSIYRMYYEETELCVRLQKAGWKLVVEPAAHARHHVYSMKGGVPARHFAFYFIRNNLLFWNRNFGKHRWQQLPSLGFIFLKEVVLPARRAMSWGQALEIIGIGLDGLLDGWKFVQGTDNDPDTGDGDLTKREARWFKR